MSAELSTATGTGRKAFKRPAAPEEEDEEEEAEGTSVKRPLGPAGALSMEDDVSGKEGRWGAGLSG